MLLTQRAPSMIATSNNNASNTTHGMPPIEVLRQTLLQALAKIDHCFGKGVTPVRSHKGYKWRRERSTDDDGSIAINFCNSNSKLSGYIRAIDSLKSLKSSEIYRNPKNWLWFPRQRPSLSMSVLFFSPSIIPLKLKVFLFDSQKDLSRGLLTNQRLLHGWAPNHYPHNVEVANIRRVACGTTLQSNIHCKFKLRLRLLYFYNKLLTNNISIIHLKICWLFLFVVVVRRTYALKLQLKQFSTSNTCFSI